MKYIICKNNGTEEAIIFSKSIQHSDMAKLLGITPVSAGHFMMLDGTIFATGESVTLGIKSRAEDAAVIKRCFQA